MRRGPGRRSIGAGGHLPRRPGARYLAGHGLALRLSAAAASRSVASHPPKGRALSPRSADRSRRRSRARMPIMEPAVLITIGAVLLMAVGVALIAYRRHQDVRPGSESEDDDEANESELRAAGETAALMDGDSLPKNEEDKSALFSLRSLFRREKRPAQAKKTLMHRRNKGVKKIHKPYFYPLLDETAQWFADWESKKHGSAEVVEVRTDKPKDARESLDCVPLGPFRSSSHTVLPVATV